MAIENSVSNDFYLRSSIVLTFSIAAYPVLTPLGRMHISILKDFKNAPPAKMLIYCQNVLFNYVKNKID